MNFSIELAKQLVESENPFPVSLDDAWQWLGYAEKRNALDTLKSYFEEDVDFSSSNPKSMTGGRPSNLYLLTVSCFKEMGMLAKTVQGKQIRKYFLECERLLREVIISTKSVQQPPKLGSSVEATATAIDPLRRFLKTVPDALVEGFLLNELQHYHPELKASCDRAHLLLAATNPIPEILLTPTAIGQRLGISARTVNLLLTSHGFQTKNPTKTKTDPAYLPTPKGKEYSSNTLATGRGEDNTSYQHIKWNESIVDVLRDLM